MTVATMKLPTEKRKATRRWIDQKFLMIGPGKVGKSAFWAEGEKTLFLEFEPGLNHLNVLAQPLRTWDELKELYLLLKDADANTFPYDTIVFDTVDRMVDLATEEVIANGRRKYAKMAQDINGVGDVPNGAGWAWQKELISNVLRKFEELPAASVLIGHWNNKEIKEPTRTYHRDTISIGGQTGMKIIHWADHTLHVRVTTAGDTQERLVLARPTATVEAGSRGELVPPVTKWSPDMHANYQALRQLFN